MKQLKHTLGIITLSLFGSLANAGVITDWEGTGVDFYSSWLDADTLRIEIDAGSRSGGWSTATHIDAIAINAPDAWSWSGVSDIQLSGPGSFGGDIDGTGLNAGGCQGIRTGGNHQCWSGLASLVDDMYFDFTFQGGAVLSEQTDTPHLKVRFVNDSGRKVGSLLSADLESVEVTEPGTVALFGLGLAGLLIGRRKLA